MASRSQEIHLHVHLHSEPAEDDAIMTAHTYGKRQLPDHPGQLGLEVVSDDATTHSPQAITVDTAELPVAITPQTVRDQRTEISATSTRNEHLMSVDERLSYAHGRKAAAERIKLGFLQGYDEESLRSNARKARKSAARELSLACGHCALDCAIRDNFVKWERVHESADERKTADQESRASHRRRLLKNSDAHCLPGKDKQN